MIFRLFFFVLLAANIGWYAWTITQQDDAATVKTLPELPGQPLLLLKEREQQLLSGQTVEGGEDGDNETCYSLGPFTNQADVRKAFNVIAPAVDRTRQRQALQTQDRGFWVYLPAVESREAALMQARELSAMGVRDYYVVTTGDNENTVSLGVFRDEANARRRQSGLERLGFDAKVDRRTEETLFYWLDYAKAAGVEPPWERVVASTPNVDHRPINCFR